jgi:ABC-2 type transport system permease protein
MVSRLAVQILSMLAMSVVVLVAAAVVEKVTLDPAAYLLALLAVIFSSAVFLGVGQALVGLLKSPDTVNAVGRVSYLPLFVLGLFAHSTIFGTTFETVARWSPGGAVATLLAGAMQPTAWSADTWWALLASVLYAIVFAGVGIRWFQWSTR